jgi:hypothetical protein
MTAGSADPQHDLPGRIAAEAGLSRQAVLTVFQQCGLPLVNTAALPRPLRVSRLRIAGDRTVEPEGPFDTTLDLDSGLTVLVADNLRGKTSVLELITWCLRGTYRRDDLQGVVKSWLSELDCDAVVAGRPLGFRLTMDHGTIYDARILSAPTLRALEDVRVARHDRGVTEVVAVEDETAYGDAVATLMLDLMNLGRLENASATAATGKAVHGWPVYFGAVYLPAGGDRALLGDIVMGGIAGRLLQVFLDVPSAALLTSVKATRDARAAAAKAEHADVARLHALQAQQYEQTLQQMEHAKERLAAVTDQSDAAESIASLAESVAVLGRALVGAEARLRDAQQAYDVLRAQRQGDEKALNDLRESAAARALFHALDPVACPRCESPVTTARRVAEREAHTCAVCTTSVVIADDESSRQSIEDEAKERIRASREAERVAREELTVVAAAARSARRKVEDVEQRLQLAERAAQAGERAELTAAIARLEGMLSVLKPPDGATSASLDDTQRVLNAAVKVLDADGVAAAKGLFDALNAEIVTAAQRFGMRDLERVQIDRGARLKVWKVGGPQEWFKGQSPGERLRLRIAVVVALLRVGTQFGLATHPGLLMVDSPKAEEVQDVDATALLGEFERLTAEIPGLQAILTLVDEPLAREVLSSSNIIAPATPGGPMW